MMKDHIQICEQAARKAAEILLEMQNHISVKEKAPADLVTDADIASQSAIFDILSRHFPEYGLLGEEDIESSAGGLSSEFCWIVDPLDGTTNYAHGMDNFSISIGLAKNGEMIEGLVYDPSHDQLFTAVDGRGAFKNGVKLRTSGVQSLGQALVATSFSPKIRRNSPDIRRFIEVLCECQALRRMGSAALNFCYVAAGRLDAYWATSLKIWDLAAGSLIVKEAGGVITSMEGQPFQLAGAPFVTAGNLTLHQQLVDVLAIEG